MSALKCYLLMLTPLKQTITTLSQMKHHDSRIGTDTGSDGCPKLYSLVSNNVGLRTGGWLSLLSYLGVPIQAPETKKLELGLLGGVGTWNDSPL